MLVSIEPNKDAFISNKILNASGQLATGSNTGLAGALTIFHMSGTDNPTKVEAIENSRILLNFDLTDFTQHSNIGFTAESGTYTLKMYDAPLAEILPSSFIIEAYRISGSWDEGNGFDLQGLGDLGPVNWISSSNSSPWSSNGGDFYNNLSASQTFSIGTENLEMNITNLVTDALASGSANLGVMLKLTNTLESGSAQIYPKAFFARHTGDPLRKPRLEGGVTTDITQDQRGGVTLGNTSPISMYWLPRGTFENAPSNVSGSFLTGSDVFEVIVTSSLGFQSSFSGSYIKTGIYSAPIFIPSSGTIAENLQSSGSVELQDWWYRDTDGLLLHSGKINIVNPSSDGLDAKRLRCTVKNLKNEYFPSETPLLQVFISYVNNKRTPVQYLPSENNSVFVPDVRYEVRDSETGALMIQDSSFTRTSSSTSGNFFYFPMTNLAPGRVYEFNFYSTQFGDRTKLNESPQKFKILMPVTIDGNTN